MDLDPYRALARWEGEPAGWLTWTELLLGGTASPAAKIAAAQPTLTGRVVAAWSPLRNLSRPVRHLLTRI
jgi:hypothetical protein